MSATNNQALVCGASRGIGAAVAQALAADGLSVTLLARSAKVLAAACDELPAESGQTHDWIACDVTDTQALKEAVTGREFQVLINNSGGPAPGTAIDADPEDFENAFRQHLIANQVLVQALAPGMKDAGFGRIVNVISTSVREPIPGLGVSNTVRAAVAAWAKTLSRELAPFGITVNNVLPGYTATGRLDQIFRNQAERSGKTLEEIMALRQAEVPAGRFAEPAEIAAVVAFLASPAASYVNGTSLAVDGGRSRGS